MHQPAPLTVQPRVSGRKRKLRQERSRNLNLFPAEAKGGNRLQPTEPSLPNSSSLSSLPSADDVVARTESVASTATTAASPQKSKAQIWLGSLPTANAGKKKPVRAIGIGNLLAKAAAAAKAAAEPVLPTQEEERLIELEQLREERLMMAHHILLGHQPKVKKPSKFREDQPDPEVDPLEAFKNLDQVTSEGLDANLKKLSKVLLLQRVTRRRMYGLHQLEELGPRPTSPTSAAAYDACAQARETALTAQKLGKEVVEVTSRCSHLSSRFMKNKKADKGKEKLHHWNAPIGGVFGAAVRFRRIKTRAMKRKQAAEDEETEEEEEEVSERSRALRGELAGFFGPLPSRSQLENPVSPLQPLSGLSKGRDRLGALESPRCSPLNARTDSPFSLDSIPSLSPSPIGAGWDSSRAGMGEDVILGIGPRSKLGTLKPRPSLPSIAQPPDSTDEPDDLFGDLDEEYNKWQMERKRPKARQVSTPTTSGEGSSFLPGSPGAKQRARSIRRALTNIEVTPDPFAPGEKKRPKFHSGEAEVAFPPEYREAARVIWAVLLRCKLQRLRREAVMEELALGEIVIIQSAIRRWLTRHRIKDGSIFALPISGTAR